jgi:hypothetical protein
MTREERNRRSILERILARHTASEYRALTDLDKAGFDFHDIGEAYEQLRKDREATRFTVEQINAAWAAEKSA